MTAELKHILREVGLDNRLYILRMVNDKKATIADVKSGLRKEGVSKPFATVSRYVNSLCELGLLYESNGRYKITTLGTVALNYFEELDKNLKVVAKLGSYLSEFSLEELPKPLLHNIWVIEKAELVNDPLTWVARILNLLENTEKTVDIISSDTSHDFAEHIIKKVAKSGVVNLLRADESSVTVRIQYPIKALDNLDLESIIKSGPVGFEIRGHKDVPFHIFISDSRAACMNFPLRGGYPHMNSGFYSEDTKFLSWAEELFDYYWKKGKKIDKIKTTKIDGKR